MKREKEKRKSTEIRGPHSALDERKKIAKKFKEDAYKL